MRRLFIVAACAILLGPSGPAPATAQDATPTGLASTHCDAPPITFADTRVFDDRQEIDVNFTCEGAVLAGTLYLPLGSESHPAVVWVHGSGEAPRLTFGGDLVPTLVRAGIAVLSYDKRGVGESTGECCPGDKGKFDVLAADVVGAVAVLRARADIDPAQIGLLGASQAGWIVPVAAVWSAHVAFVALVDAPTVTYGEEHLYSKLTGEEGGGGGELSKEEIARRLAEAGPSGFDPAPFLEQLTIPGLWLYGGQDQSIPVDQSAAILDRLRTTEWKDFTVVVFPDAGHGLLDVPPSDPQALPALLAWLLDRVHVAGTIDVATPTP
jgi:pimeloyl-ACP methyl ester carboxylesterase